MRQIKNTAKTGFTLLELAVVLIIIGLIGTIGLSASRDMLDNANLVATQNRLDTIEKALFSFWQKNGRMPCPADATLAPSNANYGIEASISDLPHDCASGTPAANFVSMINEYKADEGTVPVVTLGLPKDFIYDGWKRKIGYAVSPVFIYPYANLAIPPKSGACYANTAIRIKDASGVDRSTSAVYALISYGKNGHGAYQATGTTRYNAGSTNTDEQTNCHCTSTAANSTYDGDYVQRSLNLNTTTAAHYFDDIVRYKERWQLATDEDLLNDDGYRGPDFVGGFVQPLLGAGTFHPYKNQCGAFIRQATLSPRPTNEPRGVAFTAGNKHILTYSALGCNLYKINASGVPVNLPSAFSTACPLPNTTAVMALSNNGYLAVSTSTSSAVINLWKQSGDKFIALPSLTHSAASVAGLSFSLDGNLLAVRSATTTSKIYKRKGDSFSSAAADITQPSNLSFYNVPSVLVFSPDGKYLTDMEDWTANTNSYIQNWRVLYTNPVTFSPLTSFSMGPTSEQKNLVYTPDSKYFITDLNALASYMCTIDPGDVICNGTYVNGTYNVANNPFYSGVSKTGTEKALYAFSKDSIYGFISMEGSINANLIRKTAVDDYINYNRPFQTDGTTGTSPVTPFDFYCWPMHWWPSCISPLGYSFFPVSIWDREYSYHINSLRFSVIPAKAGISASA